MIANDCLDLWNHLFHISFIATLFKMATRKSNKPKKYKLTRELILIQTVRELSFTVAEGAMLKAQQTISSLQNNVCLPIIFFKLHLHLECRYIFINFH